MTYNLTDALNSSSVLELAQATNTFMGGYVFGYAIMIMIFTVTFLSLKTRGYFTAPSFASSCWITMFVALFLRPMTLIDNFALWTTIILSTISVFVLYMSGNTDY